MLPAQSLIRCFLFLSLVVFSGILLSPQHAEGGELAFRRHVIDADSTNSACAVVDVNRDGKLDIVGGGWWYEAPTWKRHFLREVEMIRGRYDDYSNLPLDVNADGWMDLISVNYRSKNMYWIEHPGKSLGPWKTHLIAMPGSSETGRLVDVDGDGVVDLLPNGTSYAAWWKLVREPDKNSNKPFRWVRQPLPDEVAAHGIGFGDIDGDGRNDIVTPNGWFRAPKNRRTGRWFLHPQFKLHRDCSIPMLVYDVDGDGDNDIVWSHAHHTGLYWLEQAVIESDKVETSRTWTYHTIDASWSQAHALLLGDLDNDGTPELIAGKRYMGHDGKDPGEYDPMTIRAYSFDRKQKTWKETIISVDWSSGFGLDPKLADIDADGDLDIIAPGRSGLYLFENLLHATDRTANTSQTRLPNRDYKDHTKLLVFKDQTGKLQPVTTPAHWAHRRAHILESMQRVMGNLPDASRRVPLDVQVLETKQTPKYVRKQLTFAVEQGDRVPAYLLVPHNLQDRAPAMLCLHQTNRRGKDEPVALSGRSSMHYAHELAQRGYICLVPDYPSFGDYKYDFSSAKHNHASGSMKAVWNNIRAIDLLESLPEVDRDRIGCIGHSLGAH
ncbi:MAG: VCBS repeat-containing protein, partial [Planctomycetes bacterium]|nr:VCBS repeat-containing protein [Planctomycetota bacterium]